MPSKLEDSPEAVRTQLRVSLQFYLFSLYICFEAAICLPNISAPPTGSLTPQSLQNMEAFSPKLKESVSVFFSLSFSRLVT